MSTVMTRCRIAHPHCSLALAICLLLGGAATAQVNPFAPAKGPDYLPGAVYLSDGSILVGGVRLTPGRPLRAWLPKEKQRLMIPLETISELTVSVTKTRIEKNWRFKYSGSPEKVYTGETYPRLDFAFSFTFRTGDVLDVELPQGTPIYVLPDEPETKDNAAQGDAPAQKPRRKPLRFLLQPYTIGKVGEEPKDVVHVARLVVGEEAKAKALSDLKAREAKATDAAGKTDKTNTDAAPADEADNTQ